MEFIKEIKVYNIIELIDKCRMDMIIVPDSEIGTIQNKYYNNANYVVLAVNVDIFFHNFLKKFLQNILIKTQYRKHRKFIYMNSMLYNMFNFKKQLLKDVQDSKIRALPPPANIMSGLSESKCESSSFKFHHETFGISKDNFKKIFFRESQEQAENFGAWKNDADKGLPIAQFHTGMCYENGIGIYKSPLKAAFYYQLSADQGNIGAQLCLANLYERGDGVSKSNEKMFYYYHLAADQGSGLAQALVGKCFEEGKGTAKSLERSIQYYQLSSKQNCTYGLEYLANAYKNGLGIEKSTEKAKFYENQAISIIKASAHEGEADAQFQLGLAFLLGDGVSKSNEKAFYYYKLSAEQNLAEGQFELAECYADGIGVKKSEESAKYYYKLSSDQGFAFAQFHFGLRLLLGRGLKQSFNEAVEYFKLVLTSTDVSLKSKAQYYLATCYENGAGVKQSDENALYLYKLAADHGLAYALYNLGDIYEKGRLGLVPSAEKASYYYTLGGKIEQEFSLVPQKKIQT